MGMPIARNAFDASYPIVDGHIVPGPPFETYAAGRFHDVPLLTGSAADERAGVPYLSDPELYVADARAELGGSPTSSSSGSRPATPAATASRASARTPTGSPSGRTASGAAARPTARGAPNVPLPARLPPSAGAPRALREHAPARSTALRAPVSAPRLARARLGGAKDADRVVLDTLSAQILRFCQSGDRNGPGLPDMARVRSAGPRNDTLGDVVAPRPCRR